MHAANKLFAGSQYRATVKFAGRIFYDVSIIEYILAKDTRRVWNSAMGTAAKCTNCHVLPSFELNLTKAKFIRGRVNSRQPVTRMFVYNIRRLDRSPFCFIRSILSKLEVTRKRLYMDYIYPGCMSYVVM